MSAAVPEPASSPPGAYPVHRLVGWSVLRTTQLVEGACTFWWRRGDEFGLMLRGRPMDQDGDQADMIVFGRVPVDPVGWTDLAEVRRTGAAWLRQYLTRQGGQRGRAS